MAKKFVVRRDLRKRRGRGAPYLKYLAFAALALLFLVVIAPYLLKPKSRDVTRKMPVPDRGAVTKQLPKLAPQQPGAAKPDGSASAATAPGAVKSTESVTLTIPEPPGSVKPSQTQPAPQPAEKDLTSSGQASPAETETGLPAAGAAGKPSTPAQPPQAAQKPLFPATPKASTPVHQAQPPQVARKPLFPPVPKVSAPVRQAQKPQTVPKVLFPKKASRSTGPAAESQRAKAMKVTGAVGRRTNTALSAKPAHEPMARHGAQHGLRPGLSGSYAVQVGSIFRTFGQAESLRKRLSARGYRSSVRRVADLGYLVVTSPGTKSSAYTLLVQMNAEGLKNVKVVPVDPNSR